jgi:hypothetical protein
MYFTSPSVTRVCEGKNKPFAETKEELGYIASDTYIGVV